MIDRDSRKGPIPRPVDERFWEKVDKDGEGGCWLWTAYVSPLGYGLFRLHSDKGAATRRAHRVAYELAVGPIPDGLTIDHLCRNRACVNPAHLEPVTRQENTLRSPIAPAAVNSRRAECIHGHPLDEANTYTAANGSRQCRPCHTARRREARKRARLLEGPHDPR